MSTKEWRCEKKLAVESEDDGGGEEGSEKGHIVGYYRGNLVVFGIKCKSRKPYSSIILGL